VSVESISSRCSQRRQTLFSKHQTGGTMTLEPETQDSIFTRIRDAIAAASNITNFSKNSPERAISDDGFAAEMRERQHEALSVQLSARIDYAGATITEQDLDDLNLDPDVVDLDLLNSYQEDQDLDELAKRNGVTRDPGSFATGTVTFQTQNDGVVVPKGTIVSTPPDSPTGPIEFGTTEEVSPSAGSTSVDAPIQAVERGTKGNVGSGTIEYMPSPPAGVQGDPAVTNANATTGGEIEETNAELRERAKRALIETSGGGTKGGVEGGLVSKFDGLDEGDVVVDEFPNADPIYADVIVDGGPSDSDAKDAIAELKPVAVAHNLVRPTEITIDVSADVTGSDIDTTEVESDINDYLSGLGIGEDMIRDQLVATIMTANDGIRGIDSLSVSDSGGTISDDKTIGDREKAEPGTVSVTVV
jgi:uncharacterized phage protein gp47/JayE